MSQNFVALTARAADGTTVRPNLDANGNMLVAQGASPISTQTQVNNCSGDVAAATATATLAAAAAKTTHIAGLLITGSGATAASVVSATITGLIGGTLTIPLAVPAGATVGLTPLFMEFNPPRAASAANTAIAVTLPSLGTGNLHASVCAWGHQV
jgi:hypothetical protein